MTSKASKKYFIVENHWASTQNFRPYLENLPSNANLSTKKYAGGWKKTTKTILQIPKNSTMVKTYSTLT